ncbi:hypothetical protein V6N11_075346 [Hibiscus sabdariffa]|uniref:Reverse transcriptase n=1 Tax=Hibiscus sabdariffa TaxID=183260 RepID=A0ABR2R6Y1_9ROSI
MNSVNPNAMRGVESYENLGGWPPEGFRADEESKDIEVGYEGASGLNGSSHGNVPMTYAAVAAKRSHTDDRHGEEERLEPDDVVVLDEDCIVENSRAFPMIRFSDRVHNQLDMSMWNVIIESCKASGVSGEADQTTTNIPVDVSGSSAPNSSKLYGPWMVATNRRRRNTNQVVKDRAGFNGVGSGSRFVVLQNVSIASPDMDQAIKRVVEGDSKKQKKGSVGKGVNSSVVIIPLQSDSRPEFVVPRVVPGNGNHVVVSIVKPEVNVRGGSRAGNGISFGHWGRVGMENVNKGLRIRKNVDYRNPGVVRGMVDKKEDDPGEIRARECLPDLVVLSSSVDTIAGGWRSGLFAVTTIYASLSISLRKFLWQTLAQLDMGDSLPWLIGGDFNAILSNEDRSGGILRGSRPNANICFDFEKSFRFLAAWQDHPGFGNFLKFIWSSNGDSFENLTVFQEAVQSWNNEIFGHIGRRKKVLLARLRSIDRALQKRHSDFLVDLDSRLRKELDIMLEQEEKLWFQKAGAMWVHFGDHNTQFFHASAKSRYRVNSILRLKKDDGEWCEDQDELKELVVSYFQTLFTYSGVVKEDDMF